MIKNRTIPIACSVVVLSLIVSFADLKAQAGFFNFTYPGPNTLPVGPTCSANLGQLGTPIVSSTVGAAITASYLDTIALGFGRFDPIVVGINQIVFWSVEDDQGRSATFQFTVNTVDVTPPAFDLTGMPDTVYFQSLAQVPAPPTLPVSDNCTPVSVTFSETMPPPLCQAGQFTRIWTAKDTFNNTRVFTQTLIIEADVNPPTISTFPQSGSALCGAMPAAYTNWLNAQMTAFTPNDPSGIATKTNNAPPVFPSGCPVPLTVVFRATDNCGLIVTTTAVFTVSDLSVPTSLQEPADTVFYCAYDGSHVPKIADWISKRGYLVAADDCTPANELEYFMEVNGALSDSLQVLDSLWASFAKPCDFKLVGNTTYPKVAGVVRVDFFARDRCDKIGFLGQGVLGVIDTLPPMVTGVEFPEECGGGDDAAALQSWINNLGYGAASDDCSDIIPQNFTWETSDMQLGVGIFNAGPYPSPPPNVCDWYVDVTFYVADKCGNEGSGTLRFRILDTTPPVFIGLSATDTLPCPAELPTAPDAVIADNCDLLPSVTFSRQVTDSLCTGAYSVQVVWTATDDCGNSSTAQQVFVIRDVEGPQFTLVPEAYQIACDTFALPPDPLPNVQIAATDACGLLVGYSTQIVSGQDPDSAVCGHYQYPITRIFTATDDCGNTRTATQVIQVIDQTPPVFAGFMDTTGVCDVIPPLVLMPIAFDACSGPAAGPTLQSEVLSAGICPDDYLITRIWLASDVCGNTATFSQQIAIRDTVAPTLNGLPPDASVSCAAVPAPPALASLVALDNCDAAPVVVFGSEEIRDPDQSACGHWHNYQIRRTWTVGDQCGNTRQYVQTLTVIDDTPPTLEPPPAFSLPNDPGVCAAGVGLPAPLSLYDACSSLPLTVVLRDTVPITGLVSGSAVVDTIRFEWVIPDPPPLNPVVGAASLDITLQNADADTPDEFFRIYGENGVLLGQTQLASVQCGSGTTTLSLSANQLNAWIADGALRITLAPNGAGPNAVNNICPGGRAIAALNYTYRTQQTAITLEYSVDGGILQDYPPPGPVLLDVGAHTLTYVARDCAGNTASASYQIVVEDQEAPIVMATDSLTVYTKANNCMATATLPFPGITENCALSGQLSLNSPMHNLVFEPDPNVGLTPVETQLTIAGVTPNAVYPGELRIRFRGDNAQTGEFFYVFDENDNLIGQTSNGPVYDECLDFHETVFPVSAAQINAWAADGLAGFRLVANTEAGVFSDFISPCGPLNPDKTDGVSRVQASISYNYAIVSYEIRRQADNQLAASGTLTGNQTLISLPPGIYNALYSVAEMNGNEGQTTWTITARDTTPPIALCKNIIIFANPSGATYTLQAAEIENGSSDNCKITNFGLSPSVFNCNMAGGVFPVTLTATDASGNTASCIAQVRVETESPIPTYTPVCEGQTLELFANPPSGQFSYQWTGQPNLGFQIPDPVLNNAGKNNEGLWTVTVTGVTGCTAVGSVNVSLLNLPGIPPLSSQTGTSICAGTNIVLQTNTFVGSNVSYQWFAGTPLNPILLATTLLPTYTIEQPTPGLYQFHVKILGNNCSSEPSAVLNVTVNNLPVATVLNEALSLCSGEEVILGTTLQAPGLSYQWTGPGGYTNNQQYPPTFIATTGASGPYCLVVTQNGCISAPACTQVNVAPTPPKPAINGLTALCAGADLVLVCNATGGTQYEWISPGFISIFTNGNSLTMPNINAAQHAGQWRVRVRIGNCFSDFSDPITVMIEGKPSIAATALKNPICQGEILQLQCTTDAPAGSGFSWTGPNGFANFMQNPVVNPGVGGGYWVRVTTPNSCRDSALVQVVISPLPVITAVTNNAPLCSDGSGSAELQATIVSGQPPLSYAWTGPPIFGSSTLPNPIIPNINAAYNGSYNLVVTDALNCVSLPGTTIINTQNKPPRPTLAPLAPVCAGATVTLQITNPPVGGVLTYTWITPAGTVVNNKSFLAIPNAQPNASGQYAVFVKQGPCESDTSLFVTLTVNPVPPPPPITANTPLCEGETLQLSVPQGFSTYSWGGPSGFTAAIHNPSRLSVTQAMSGIYQATVTLNGCAAAASAIEVNVLPRPATPVALPVSPICISHAGAALTLSVSPGSATPGAMYRWYYGPDNTPLGPASFALSQTFGGLDVYGEGTHSFYVIASLGDCTSPPVFVSVQLDAIPSGQAFAGQDFNACSTAPFNLQAAPLMPGITGLWTPVGHGLGIVNPTSPVTQVLGGQAGQSYRFRWTLSKGGCMNYSSDTVQVNVAAPEYPDAVNFIDTCFATSIYLSAQQGMTQVGSWEQPSTQQLQLGVVIADPGNPNTLVQNLVPGNTYFFYWVFPDIGCGKFGDTVTVRIIGSDANAGPDRNICNNDPCELLQAAPLPTGETGQWTSPDLTLQFTNPFNPVTTVCNLKVGPNILIWTSNNGFCGDRSTDTVILTYELMPRAVQDAFTVPFGALINFDVLTNDVLPQQFNLTIEAEPFNGTLTPTEKGKFTYRPDIGFSGDDEFTYKICNFNCTPEPSCSVAKVILRVQGADECIIPTIITPNGDRVNDEFNINCLGEGNQVQIFNQWGHLVFSAAPYDNNWSGNFNGEPLPAGTYYFAVRINAEAEVRTGFLVIQR